MAENGLLVSISAHGSPSEYGDQFRLFASWIVGSLDSFKEELGQLLYPAFVYAYISMIQLEASTSAKDLLSESKDLFLSQASNKNRKEILMKEIHEFSKITSPEQLHESSMMVNILKQKVSLNISAFTYDLLLQYLRQEKLLLMMSLLNRWFSLNIVQDFDCNLLSFWSATANVDVSISSSAQVSQGKLNLELLKDSPYLKYQEIQLKLKIDDLEGLESEEMTKAQKTEHNAALELYREKLGKVLNRGIQSSIPLPKTSMQTTGKNLEEEIRNQIESGSLRAPPCAFASFMNSNDVLNSITMSSDLKNLVAGFSDSTIRVYDVSKKGHKTKELSGHIGPVYSVNYSETNSNMLLSSSGDGSIRLWSMELASNLSVYYGHMLPVWDVSFAPTFGHYFASGGADKTCRLWDTERKSCLRAFAGHNADVEVVKWHPNCQILASGSSDHHIRLWDISSGACISVLSGHKAPITSLEFAPSGDLLASGDADGQIFCWNLASGNGSYQLVGNHKGPVWSIAWPEFSIDQIVTGGDDCAVRVWNMKNLQEGLSTNLLATWGTKATPVSYVRYGNYDQILFGAGAFSIV